MRYAKRLPKNWKPELIPQFLIAPDKGSSASLAAGASGRLPWVELRKVSPTPHKTLVPSPPDPVPAQRKHWRLPPSLLLRPPDPEFCLPCIIVLVITISA